MTEPGGIHRRYDRAWPWVLALVAAMLVVYGPTVRHGFLTWDDFQHVLYNPRVNPPTWQGVAESWQRPYWGLYIPASYTWFAFEAALGQRAATPEVPSPAVFHAGNLALHVVCCVLVFLLLRRLLAVGPPWVTGHRPPGTGSFFGQEDPAIPANVGDRKMCLSPYGPQEDLSLRRNGAALVGAMLFGLHPLQVESVAWISEARGLLCATLALLAVGQYVEFALAATRRRALLHYGLATLAVALALLAKPAAVAVPLIALAIDRGLLGRSMYKAILALAPWFVLALGAAVVTKSLQSDLIPACVSPLWARPVIAGHAVLFYLGKLVLPWNLGPDYGWTPQQVLAEAAAYSAWIVPCVLAAVLAALPGRRWWLTAAAIFVAWLLPVLGLVAFDFQRISTVADRYVYLAMLGPAMAIAVLVIRFWRVGTLAAAGGVLAVLAVLSAFQATHWANTPALFAHALAVHPQSAVARYHLGITLAHEGQYKDSIVLYREALAGDPPFPQIHFELAQSLAALGENRSAEKEFRQAIAMRPGYAEAHIGLGTVLESLDDLDAARDEYRAAVAIWPGAAPAHYNLGNLALRRGDLAEAEGHFLEALQCNEAMATAHANLGFVLLEQGRVREAVGHARRALELEPRLAPAWVHLGRGLLALGEPREAAEAFQRALTLLPPHSEQRTEVQRLLRSCVEE